MALERNSRDLKNIPAADGRARQGGKMQRAANWGAQQAIDFAKDPGLYSHITRGFAEARIAFVTRWFWLAEIATLAILALFVIIDVLLWVDNHPIWGLVMLIPVVISFFLWKLARGLRRLVYRQVTRALNAFDDMVGRGVATLSDWPRFFRDWRRKNKQAQ